MGSGSAEPTLWYVTVTGSRGVHGPYRVVDLAESGRSAGVWDPEHGFCVGRREVAQVHEWTEPTEQGGALTSTVSYSWTLGDRPDWVDPEHSAQIPGVAEPVSSKARLREGDDGWEVVGGL